MENVIWKIVLECFVSYNESQAGFRSDMKLQTKKPAALSPSRRVFRSSPTYVITRATDSIGDPPALSPSLAGLLCIGGREAADLVTQTVSFAISLGGTLAARSESVSSLGVHCHPPQLQPAQLQSSQF
jgi:hypothetical protein